MNRFPPCIACVEEQPHETSDCSTGLCVAAAGGDGVTFLRLRAPWTNGIDLVRSSLTIGDRSVSMEDYPFTLGNTGIDDDRVPASPPGSPAAETLTGMITDGVGRRSGPTAPGLRH